MATLKQLVNETTNIKDELITCHTDLKNNLIDKGVEVLETDKISDLVNKVVDIEVFPENIPRWIKSGIWFRCNNSPYGGTGVRSCVFDKKEILVVTGSSSSGRYYLYNIDTDEWVEFKTKLSTYIHNLCNINGDIYCASYNKIYLYNRTLDTWELKTTVPSPANSNSLMRIYYCDGSIYALASDASTISRFILCYNMKTETWSEKQAFTKQDLTNFNGTVLGHKIFFMYRTGLKIYNALLDVWEEVSMSAITSSSVLAIGTDKKDVYVFGTDSANKKALKINAESYTSTELPDMPTARYDASATFMAGRFYVMCGRSSAGVYSNECYLV